MTSGEQSRITIVFVRRFTTPKAIDTPVLVSEQGQVDALGLDNVRDMVDNYKTDYRGRDGPST